MSTVSAPFGFRPAYSPSGTLRPNEFPDAIASGFGTQIFVGQPVKLVGGQFQPITSSSDKIYGVFAGVKFFRSASSIIASGETGWPAGATYQAGTMSCSVFTDPSIVYEVQANGSVVNASLGSQVNTASIAAGSTTVASGSQAMVSNTTVGAGVQGQWIIDSVQQAPDNAWGDNFTIVRVIIAFSQVWPASPSIG